MVSYPEPDVRNIIKKVAHEEMKKKAIMGYQPSIQTDELKKYSTTIKLDPNNPELHFNLAIENHHLVYMGEIDYNYLSQAIGGLLRAIELAQSPEQEIKYRKELGGIYQHGYGDAISQWDRILELNPNDIEANGDLARWFKHFGPVQEAVPYYKKLTLLEPENPEHFKELSDILMHKDIFSLQESEILAKKAIKLYLKQHNTGFDLSESYDILGYAYGHQKKRREAKFAFRMGLKFNPQNHTCFSGLLQTLYRLEDFEELDKQCTQRLREENRLILDLAHLFAGIREIDKGNSKKGTEYFKKIDILKSNVLNLVHKDFAKIYIKEMKVA